MGHANLSNLSDFFVNRLYAKGTLSLKDACIAAAAAGQYLQASEGTYEDAFAIGIGMMDIIHYLTRENPRQHGYSGPDGGGPWIVPELSVWRFGGKQKLSGLTRRMLADIEAGDHDELTVGGAADRLHDEGFVEWSEWVRYLPLLRRVYRDWRDDKGTMADHDKWAEVRFPGDDEWLAFDHIPWMFAPGVRKNYRDVPRLCNVTH